MNSKQTVLLFSSCFIVWKTLLLGIAFTAPGPGYDTSTTLLQGANNLVRWDAIYFVQVAQRGHIYEQEWAWGIGLSTLHRLFSGPDIASITLAGIVLSHVAHFISALLVWKIAELLYRRNSKSSHGRQIAVVAACLHIISPAGIFLSAPYSEAPFAFFNMLGYWLYLRARADEAKAGLVLTCCSIVGAGASFGIATVLRSNGILSGLLFLFDALRFGMYILSDLRQVGLKQRCIASLMATVIGGLCIAVGLLWPQYLAYKEYCLEHLDLRPWCKSSLPLIYSFVQAHYWDVGFLRYWTVSNLPLFLLASPVLYLLVRSSVDELASYSMNSTSLGSLGMYLAIPQLILAILAATSFHVQVITRLSSGYPWLYIWVAHNIGSEARRTSWVARFFVLYSIIQAGLFASFLPPA